MLPWLACIQEYSYLCRHAFCKKQDKVSSVSSLRMSQYKADEDLGYALQHCHQSAAPNRRRILKYLIPVKLLLGSLPAPGVLQQHGLQHYSDIVDAMQSGSIQQLNAAVEGSQHRYIMEVRRHCLACLPRAHC